MDECDCNDIGEFVANLLEEAHKIIPNVVEFIISREENADDLADFVINLYGDKAIYERQYKEDAFLYMLREFLWELNNLYKKYKRLGQLTEEEIQQAENTIEQWSKDMGLN